MNEISVEKRLILEELRRQRRLRLATGLFIDVTNPIISGKFIRRRDVDLELDHQLAQLPLGLLTFGASFWPGCPNWLGPMLRPNEFGHPDPRPSAAS